MRRSTPRILLLASFCLIFSLLIGSLQCEADEINGLSIKAPSGLNRIDRNRSVHFLEPIPGATCELFIDPPIFVGNDNNIILATMEKYLTKLRLPIKAQPSIETAMSNDGHSIIWLSEMVSTNIGEVEVWIIAASKNGYATLVELVLGPTHLCQSLAYYKSIENIGGGWSWTNGNSNISQTQFSGTNAKCVAMCKAACVTFGGTDDFAYCSQACERPKQQRDIVFEEQGNSCTTGCIALKGGTPCMNKCVGKWSKPDC